MKRSLITQMRNEWRSNVWIITELVVVSGILWFIFLFLGISAHIRLEKKGYDTSDICVATIRRIPDNSSAYSPYGEGRDSASDLQLLIANLRHNPNAEIVGYGINCRPYQYNYFGSQIHTIDGKDTYNVNIRTMTPEVIRILRIEGPGGETPEQLANVIAQGEMVLGSSEHIYPDTPDEKLFLGKEVFTNDSTQLTKVGALAYGLRRSDYEMLWSGVLYQPLSLFFPQNSDYFPSDILIRVKPGKSKEFMASLKSADKQVGNVYLSGLASLEKFKEEAHFNTNSYIRNFSVGAMFLFVIIFLGFLGSFWFRVQQRVGEIAIRKVNGATATQIFRRLLSEGMILLIFATVIAIPLELILCYYGIIPLESLFGSNGGSVRWESMAITFALLALMIVGGIWFPARKAMKINPALALKDL